MSHHTEHGIKLVVSGSFTVKDAGDFGGTGAEPVVSMIERRAVKNKIFVAANPPGLAIMSKKMQNSCCLDAQRFKNDVFRSGYSACLYDQNSAECVTDICG